MDEACLPAGLMCMFMYDGMLVKGIGFCMCTCFPCWSIFAELIQDEKKAARFLLQSLHAHHHQAIAWIAQQSEEFVDQHGVLDTPLRFISSMTLSRHTHPSSSQQPPPSPTCSSSTRERRWRCFASRWRVSLLGPAAARLAA